MALFGTSGIRRLADRTLLELALEVGMALGKSYPNIIVGHDSRTSSEALRYATLAGILSTGGRPSVTGLVPTPTVAIAGRHFDAAVMITASHNPPEYNGIKLLNPDGSSFSPEQQHQLELEVADDRRAVATWDRMGRVEQYPGAVEHHIHHIRAHFPGRFPVKVVLDCAGAAASVITPGLLERMGCDVICLNCQPTGFFLHPVEPVVENVSGLISAVRETGADLGIVHDGDADRMMVVDNRGTFISGDKMLRLMATELGARAIVTTIDASMATEQASYSVTRTPVGDNHVCEALKKGGYDFGGEPSGAWIYPHSSFCPDGIFAAALIVSVASKAKLSDIVDELPDYPIYRGSFPNNGISLLRLEEKLVSTFSPASVSRIDGLKCTLKDGWFLVRPSGTEPRIRLTIEAANNERLDMLKRLLVDTIMRGG